MIEPVGVGYGAVAEAVEPWMPAGMPDSLAMLTEMFATAAPMELALLLFAVCVVAPIVEEVVFRGYLWAALARSMPEPLVLVCTTLLFSAYHVYPVQALALLPTSVLFGWLRWRSRALLPAVIAHGVNNALAAGGTLLGADASASVPGWWIASAGLLSLLSIVAVEVWTARRTE